ncbi:EF hand protein (macronuclear) [Tetrahymena thermophila SB210]|uniref:EF hand protein n=2 Tax=Tetrahymena thermophila TaxID=5911 RepID=W7XK83_TETTS|nr:EF hand protein [Tetrahymena thermophila SB210]AIT58614.1 Tpt1 [Tetrahymena thermophila]EWS74699.1 EF hand protein [Tetrahymena thermophila SB210]|eukprot:XP_012652789.1 EF hand protein [Tetrahymena thermophila SB210]
MDQENLQAQNELIDLEACLPKMIEQFSISIDKEYVISNFQMRVQDDGITICDQKGLIYELNTGQQDFFEHCKDKLVTISQGIVKPEFETNTQKLIFTMFAQDIQLSPNQEDLIGESSYQSNEPVNARFKIFDMENNKKKQEIYEKSFIIKKQLVKKHSQNLIMQQGNDIWISLTQSYKIQQFQVQEEQARQQQKLLQEQHKKQAQKKEQVPLEKEDIEDEKKQSFKTPSKKGKTPLKSLNKQDEEAVAPQSNKKSQKRIKYQEDVEVNQQISDNKPIQMEIEQAESGDNKEELAAEGAVSVAKEKKTEIKQHLIQNQRKNLQEIYEKEKQAKKQVNKKRIVQMEDIEYEEEDIDDESDEENEQNNQDDEEIEEEEQEAFVNKQPVKQKDSELKQTDIRIDEKNTIEEKQNKKSILKVANAEKQSEIIKSLKKKSIQKAKEAEEIEISEQMKAQLQKQQEYKQKLDKLQKFVLKREFLYYVQDFQKKPQVRNAVLPRDPNDKEKMKQYSLKVVKHLESQYK